MCSQVPAPVSSQSRACAGIPREAWPECARRRPDAASAGPACGAAARPLAGRSAARALPVARARHTAAMAEVAPHPRDLLDLTGRVAVVTGASQGIGAAIATRFAAAGAQVVVHYRRGAGGATADGAGIFRGGGSAIAVGGEPPDARAVQPPFVTAPS